jgi:gliding motility-associated-like protein
MFTNVKSLFFLLILSLIHIVAKAQLCTGSLGEPLINKTFGSGPNPGAPLAAASTNYQFASNDCPNDGLYTIRNNTFGCFGSSWHNLPSDHTGDPNGYFMLVNASVQPGAFYIDTVKGLCAGTTFEFAAWITNVLKQSACGGNGTMPNITFSIERTDGTLIQNYSTGDIAQKPVAVWEQYGFFFTTPTGVSDVVLRIVNNAPGGCGNDIALDDITFRPCGPLINGSIIGQPGDTAVFCQGTSRSFNFTTSISGGYANPVYQWQQSFNGGAYTNIPTAGVTTLNIFFAANTPVGVYRYRLTATEASTAGCGVASLPLTIIVDPLPVLAIQNNSPLCVGELLTINSSGAAQYNWTGPNAYTATGPVVTIANMQVVNAGKYYLDGLSSLGCVKKDSVLIVVNPVPTATVSFTSATICEGDTLQLSSNGGGTYSWQPATGLSSAQMANPLAFPADNTNYRLVVSNSFNCTDTAFVNIDVIKKPIANAGADKTAITGIPVTLDGIAGGDNINFVWSPAFYLDNPFIIQPAATPPAGTYDYRLTVTSNDGCGSATDLVKVTVYDGVYVPTAFTPGNNGLNDRWQVIAPPSLPGFELSVYNRAGQLIFTTKNAADGWDGKYKGELQPSGVYVYMLRYRKGNVPEIRKGTVTIIR